MEKEPIEYDYDGIRKAIIFITIAILVYVGSLILKLRDNTYKYDMPDGFNKTLISKDENNPTKMQVTYSEEQGKYLFRFILDTLKKK